MSDFHKRKKQRKEFYEKYLKGWRLKTCVACNGTGYYDSNGSPNCVSCNGTGKVRYKFDKNLLN